MFLCPSQHQNSPTHVLPFFPPDSTDLSLKCEDSKALSPQTCDFFFQKISRSNLWLTDPWQLQISLFLSLLALHLVEKLSDSHLHQAAQVFIMCMHTEYPIWCTPQRLQPSARTLHTACAAAIYPAAFLIFIAQNPLHLLFFLRWCSLSERNASVVLVLGHIGVNVHTFAPLFAFQNNAIYSENYAQSAPFKWPNGWQTFTFASVQRRNNVASVDYNHPQHIRSYLENSTTCAAALPPSRGCRQGLLVPPSVEMRLRSLSLDRMASLYAKCFA